NVKEPIATWSPCPAVNGIFYYNHPAIPEWQNSVLMAVLGGLGGQYERLSVLHMSDDGLEVESEDEYFSSFNQRVRDICVNPTTGAVYVAFNGPQYPGSGPNIIKEFVNLEYGANSVSELTIEQDIKLYPNPATDVVNLTFDDNFVGTSYQVISFTGQTVVSNMVKDNQMELDVTAFASGKYYLIATSHLGTVTRTFIVK
ncbi:MAG: T9SS type A sorting domain-containing protein, partial [Flavobacteriales bacterium]